MKDSITKEFSNDVEKYNEASAKREIRNKENLEKIWGKR
jgi:hypothetical protein